MVRLKKKQHKHRYEKTFKGRANQRITQRQNLWFWETPRLHEKI